MRNATVAALFVIRTFGKSPRSVCAMNAILDQTWDGVLFAEVLVTVMPFTARNAHSVKKIETGARRLSILGKLGLI